MEQLAVLLHKTLADPSGSHYTSKSNSTPTKSLGPVPDLRAVPNMNLCEPRVEKTVKKGRSNRLDQILYRKLNVDHLAPEIPPPPQIIPMPPFPDSQGILGELLTKTDFGKPSLSLANAYQDLEFGRNANSTPLNLSKTSKKALPENIYVSGINSSINNSLMSSTSTTNATTSTDSSLSALNLANLSSMRTVLSHLPPSALSFMGANPLGPLASTSSAYSTLLSHSAAIAMSEKAKNSSLPHNKCKNSKSSSSRKSLNKNSVTILDKSSSNLNSSTPLISKGNSISILNNNNPSLTNIFSNSFHGPTPTSIAPLSTNGVSLTTNSHVITSNESNSYTVPLNPNPIISESNDMASAKNTIKESTGSDANNANLNTHIKLMNSNDATNTKLEGISSVNTLPVNLNDPSAEANNASKNKITSTAGLTSQNSLPLLYTLKSGPLTPDMMQEVYEQLKSNPQLSSFTGLNAIPSLTTLANSLNVPSLEGFPNLLSCMANQPKLQIDNSLLNPLSTNSLISFPPKDDQPPPTEGEALNLSCNTKSNPSTPNEKSASENIPSKLTTAVTVTSASASNDVIPTSTHGLYHDKNNIMSSVSGVIRSPQIYTHAQTSDKLINENDQKRINEEQKSMVVPMIPGLTITSGGLLLDRLPFATPLDSNTGLKVCNLIL